MENRNLKIYENLFKETSKGTREWRIGVYVRLSKDDGNSVSLSIVNQIKLISRYLGKMDDFTVVDVFIDDNQTGTDFDRADYMRLQNYIDNKLVNCMIVKDLTRYSRNLVEAIKELDDYVLRKKIRFIACGHPFIDTLVNPTSISSAEVYQALQSAEDHARITSKKVRDIKAIKMEDGQKNGGFPGYGYLPNPTGEYYLYDEVAGANIQMMFQWSLEGMSDREIAKKLNEMGIPNPTKYKQELGLKYKNPHAVKNSGLWCPTTVGRLLANRNYIGCSVQGKSSCFDHKRHKQEPKKKEEYIIVPDCLPKTVNDELFNQVNEIRAQRTRVTKTTGKVHIFANLVYCAHCKRAMKKTSNAKKTAYLVCRTYKDAGEAFCKRKMSISFKQLEEIVLDVIKSQINLAINLKTMVDKLSSRKGINKKSQRLDKMIESIKAQIEKTEHIYDSSYIDWKNDDISKEQYKRIRADTEKKLNQYRDDLEKLIMERQQFEENGSSNDNYFNTFLKYQNITKLDRMVLLELIERIYIHEDKSIDIHFKLKDQYQLILDFVEQNTSKEEFQKILKKK